MNEISGLQTSRMILFWGSSAANIGTDIRQHIMKHNDVFKSFHLLKTLWWMGLFARRTSCSKVLHNHFRRPQGFLTVLLFCVTDSTVVFLVFIYFNNRSNVVDQICNLIERLFLGSIYTCFYSSGFLVCNVDNKNIFMAAVKKCCPYHSNKKRNSQQTH